MFFLRKAVFWQISILTKNIVLSKSVLNISKITKYVNSKSRTAYNCYFKKKKKQIFYSRFELKIWKLSFNPIWNVTWKRKYSFLHSAVKGPITLIWDTVWNCVKLRKYRYYNFDYLLGQSWYKCPHKKLHGANALCL